jgi:hypothetical protein
MFTKHIFCFFFRRPWQQFRYCSPTIFALRRNNTDICNYLRRTCLFPVFGSLCPVLLSTASQLFAPHNDLSICGPPRFRQSWQRFVMLGDEFPLLNPCMFLICHIIRAVKLLSSRFSLKKARKIKRREKLNERTKRKTGNCWCRTDEIHAATVRLHCGQFAV